MKQILFALFLSFFLPIWSIQAKEYNKDDLVPCQDDENSLCDTAGNVINGLVETYHDNKILKYKSNFKNGKCDGIAESYNEDGKLNSRMTFKEGRPSGIWLFYFADGKVESQIKFEKDGAVFTIYDRAGNIATEEKYADGHYIRHDYDKNKVLRAEVNYLLDGAENTFSVKFRKGAFDLHAPENSIQEGSWKTYSESGSLVSEENCKNEACVQKTYDDKGQPSLEMYLYAKDRQITSGYVKDPDGKKTEIPNTEFESFGQDFHGLSVIARANVDLYRAAERGNLKEVQRLVEDGYNLNMTCYRACSSGWTPLMIASANGHLDVVKFLLENGANPNAQNWFGRSALMFATRYRFTPIIEVLLDHGADPTLTSQDKDQNSAMADALIFSLLDPTAYDILKILVKRTKNVNFEFWDYIPLMMAVRYDDYDFAKYLLDNGANSNHIKTVEENGKTINYSLESLAKSEKMKELILSYRNKDKSPQ